MRVLGIESSCDETAAAVVEMNASGNCTLISNVVISSLDLHAQYGGVVPEIAARSHIEAVIPVVEQAVREAAGSTADNQPDPWQSIDAIAVTYGAGLGGSLLIGVLTARTLAITKDKPLYAINHVEGHLYANFLTKNSPALPTPYDMPASIPRFPVLGLIVSGGHSQLVLFRDHFDYTLLGQTQDDAIGEAFDKVAKLLGLPYPGGISIERVAAEGNPQAFSLPKAQMKGAYDFSFSGIKTAVLRLAQQQIGKDYTFPSSGIASRLSDKQKADIAASFQRVAIETVVDKTVRAFQEFSPNSVVIGGGVASSSALRLALAERLPIAIDYADRKLCTDNGAMIATLGCFKHQMDQPRADPYSLDIKPNLSM
jgi:N6-L-threonylcarbamoyladenine synthase